MNRPAARILLSASPALLVGAVAVLACSESTAPDTRTLRGPEIIVGAGQARAEIVVDRDDRIRSLVVVFTRDALNGLPATLPGTEYILPLPADAPATVFNHVGINWQPQGHPPPMVYTHPHFDVHYYLVSMQQRDAITPADPEFAAKGAAAPPASASPPGYVGDPQAIPRMGTHWTDRGSHEFHGQPFTSTLVFGYYDARLIFIEPMMTKAFLESMPDETKPVALPAALPVAGRWPTSWRVRWDAGAAEYRVELLDFTDRS